MASLLRAAARARRGCVLDALRVAAASTTATSTTGANPPSRPSLTRWTSSALASSSSRDAARFPPPRHPPAAAAYAYTTHAQILNADGQDAAQIKAGVRFRKALCAVMESSSMRHRFGGRGRDVVVLECRMSSDFKTAHVRWTTAFDDDDGRIAERNLRANATRLREMTGRLLRSKHTPRLVFVNDDARSPAEIAVDEKLEKVRNEELAHEAARAAYDAATMEMPKFPERARSRKRRKKPWEEEEEEAAGEESIDAADAAAADDDDDDDDERTGAAYETFDGGEDYAPEFPEVPLVTRPRGSTLSTSSARAMEDDGSFDDLSDEDVAKCVEDLERSAMMGMGAGDDDDPTPADVVSRITDGVDAFRGRRVDGARGRDGDERDDDDDALDAKLERLFDELGSDDDDGGGEGGEDVWRRAKAAGDDDDLDDDDDDDFDDDDDDDDFDFKKFDDWQRRGSKP